MRAFFASLCMFGFVAISSSASAAEASFNGTWSIDLRSKAEQKRRVECGLATFVLVQNGNKISGDHTFSTPGCGRLNEGGEGTVKGVVVGNTAVLVVTSGRNGAVVMGKATTNGAFLLWQTLEEIKQGEPEGDSPLILGKGRLARQ
ncbi:MAG: hypothetical protein EPO47_07715 [Rugosibacter sp.]|nr:MAG: hypothetical protein EPO60_11470 [Rugosibacter sp.]TBR08846.1 MAG: hypothetical protein EPO47_07715 [Rugosibacter sp.]